MSVDMFLINPGPVDDICQDNAHRAGAPNHHHTSGSGENTMVGNESHATGHDLLVVMRSSEVAGLRTQVTELRAERDALLRHVEDLAWDLNDALSGRPVSSVGAMFGATFTGHDELGGGR